MFFYLITKIFKKQEERNLIVLTLGLLLVGYGISDYFGFESLLSTIALGAALIHEIIEPIISRFSLKKSRRAGLDLTENRKMNFLFPLHPNFP